MTDNTIRWKAYGHADASTEYKVYSDAATPNSFVLLTETPLAATDRGDAVYAPFTTELAEPLAAGAESVVFVDGSDFEDGDLVKIDKESILLGGKSGDTFGAITRGIGSTIDRDHAAGIPVFAMHESYLDEGVDYDGRHVIRYRVTVLLESGAELVAAEAVAVKPSKPPTNDLVTIWGIEDTLSGQPSAGVTATVTISEGINFNPGTGESFSTTSISATTDASGYWELFVPRDIARSGGSLLLSVAGRSRTLARVPDVDTICYLECI